MGCGVGESVVVMVGLFTGKAIGVLVYVLVASKTTVGVTKISAG